MASTKSSAKKLLKTNQGRPPLIVDDNVSIPEFAFYYPGIIWRWNSANWIKNLVLFFDGIALLVPEYMKDRPRLLDPAIATALEDNKLLRILEPEEMMDKDTTKRVTSSLTGLVESGAFDSFSKENVAFHELSYSRLGSMADLKLAQAIFHKLKAKGLARDSEDGVSIPMHPMVRALVLVLLAQGLRPRGKELGLNLSPATDVPGLVSALEGLLSSRGLPSAGRVVSSDLEFVGVDLSTVPIDEVLSFRENNLIAHRTYSRAVRKFVLDLGAMAEDEREKMMADRLGAIRDYASELKRLSRKAWKKKAASFALGITGAAWSWHTSSPISGVLTAFTSLLGLASSSSRENSMEAYSYVFKAKKSFPY